MKNGMISIVGSLLLLLSVTNSAWNQSYFKVFEYPYLFSTPRVAHFPNGDLLIGDSSLESLNNGGFNAAVYLNRRDNCGNVIWSFGYFMEEGHLELKDFKISENNEVFLYGSHYEGLNELIFLLKVDGNTGQSSEYKLYDPGTVDHFSYNLTYKAGKVMIYGLSFDFNSPKQGFVAIFNSSLGFEWAKVFIPFESTGAAILSNDGGFVGWSGDYLLKLDGNGDLLWFSELDAGLNLHAISGPLEVENGYLLEAHREGESYFYKVDQNGQFVWQTDWFPSTDDGAAMALLEDGTVLCTYSNPNELTNNLCQLMLASDGTILSQRQLELGSTINTGNISQTIDEEQYMTIAANVNPVGAQSAEIADYIFRFSLENLPDDCFFWEDFRETTPNSNPTNIVYHDAMIESFTMVLAQSIQTGPTDFSIPLWDYCEENASPEFMSIDTLLPCGDDWVVTLPSAAFKWSDGLSTTTRVFDQPGTYMAQSRSCSNQTFIEYTLEKEACDCQVYLPTAFSPNDDGINDQLEFFSDCSINKVEYSIFSRWGDRLFYTTNPNLFWNGTAAAKKVPPGVYIVKLRYQWVDYDGTTHEGDLVQEVTVLF